MKRLDEHNKQAGDTVDEIESSCTKAVGWPQVGDHLDVDVLQLKYSPQKAYVSTNYEAQPNMMCHAVPRNKYLEKEGHSNAWQDYGSRCTEWMWHEWCEQQQNG